MQKEEESDHRAPTRMNNNDFKNLQKEEESDQ